jgi:tRNA (guanine26-N2/guanine27-N2)-dimethyltransferase
VGVFYNGAMSLDRDLHVAVTAALAEERGPFEAGWELLAATGVRGLRVLHESGGLASLLSTDAGADAAEVLGRNAARYSAEGAISRRADAQKAGAEASFDWVDVDPFGSPVPYLDTALAAIRDGGLLSVTATDLLVLAGVQRGAAERRYGSRPVRGRLGPEGGLRILVRAIAERATQRGLSARPVVCYVHDHYVRAYLRLERRGAGSDPIGLITADRWTGPVLSGSSPWGPMWLGPLFEPSLVARLRAPSRAARPRELAALLARFREEAGADVPFYYEANSVAKATAIPAPPPTERFLTELRSAGFRAGRSHVRDGAFRTDAPRETVFEVARRWTRPTPGS